MEVILQSLLTSIRNRQQLHVLLKKAHTMVIFSTEEEHWHLFLSNSEVHTKYTDKGTYRISIIGSRNHLDEVIRGEVSLRQLQRLNKIKLQGNYRQILLVEALLLLSKNSKAV